MLPICSFSIKAKIPSLKRITSNPRTLGEYIRKERFKRGLSQSKVAKLIGVHSVSLSNWEFNRQPVASKHLIRIVEFLGFLPNLKSDFDLFGLQIKLWRIRNNCTLEEFSELVESSARIIEKIENSRSRKIEKELKRKIKQFLRKDVPNYSREVLS